jgi:hypothetical protein
MLSIKIQALKKMFENPYPRVVIIGVITMICLIKREYNDIYYNQILTFNHDTCLLKGISKLSANKCEEIYYIRNVDTPLIITSSCEKEPIPFIECILYSNLVNTKHLITNIVDNNIKATIGDSFNRKFRGFLVVNILFIVPLFVFLRKSYLAYEYYLQQIEESMNLFMTRIPAVNNYHKLKLGG